MCATCGCSGEADDVRGTPGGSGVRIIDLRPGVAGNAHEHTHADGRAHTHADGSTHSHDGGHAHPHDERPHSHPARTTETETLSLEVRILAKNDEIAAANRAWLLERGVRAMNLMSSPGSGKTTLLERTIGALASAHPVCVIEGDQETTFDADRIAATGVPVLQVNTGSGCHLDASMVDAALQELDPQGGFVLIENVGNLVCPALFDLGEQARVVVMSVTEGADKPLKYPHIFGSATLVVLNKVDLLPYVDFDLDAFERDVARVNPTAEILHVSATRGDGLDAWLDRLTS